MNQAEIRRRQAECLSTIMALVTLAVVARVTGENGVAYLAAALEIFGTIWIVISGGVSDTLGRLLRSRSMKGQYKNVLKMRRNVMLFQAVTGLVGSILVLLFAEALSEKLFRIQYSTLILSVLAPAILLRTVSSTLLGFYRGDGSELPTAVAAILRQVFILGFGFMFGRMLGAYGNKVSSLLLQDNFTSMYGGVGFAIAVSLTEGFIVIFLFLINRGIKRPKAEGMRDDMRFTDSFFDSIRIFLVNKGSQVLISLLIFLPFPLGLLFLQKSVVDGETAVTGYGAYLSGYLVICGIVVCLIYMILLPTVSKIAISVRKDEQKFARVIFQSGVHMAVVQGVFFTAFLTVLSKQAAAAISVGQAALLSEMLAPGASVILFLLLSLYFGRFLTVIGKKRFVLCALGIADAVYAVTVAVFMNAGKMGAVALVLGGVLAQGVLCALLGFLSYRQLRCRFDWLQVAVIPVGAGCVSGLLAMLLAKLLTSHVGELITLIVALAISGVLYWSLLLVLRNFKEQELEAVPGGRLINAIGQLFRVF